MIKSHKELANQIAGKNILHLNSLGKDSAVCLEWLARFAMPGKIVSVHFEFLAAHPDDSKYLEYQKKRYPNVEFITRPNGADLSNVIDGTYASPIEVITDLNKCEYIEFSMAKQAKELKNEFGCDFICIGDSKYESVARATYFYKKGLLVDDRIYPVGLLDKSQIIGIINSAGLKVHPCYKLMQSTPDYPSYYKMRALMIANPEYRKKVMAVWPLLALDAYRYERLFR